MTTVNILGDQDWLNYKKTVGRSVEPFPTVLLFFDKNNKSDHGTDSKSHNSNHNDSK